MPQRKILLVQLPIPPVGPQPIRGNVPLAAAYLKMYAQLRGLESQYRIDILPTVEANTFGDRALVQSILSRDPWLVGFTCYLWNIERTLWIAEQIKLQRPEVRVLIGGPEVTLDNAWVLDHPAVDYAAIGEGEQTFAELLAALVNHHQPQQPIAGLFIPRSPFSTAHSQHSFTPRAPLPHLNDISSPYLAGILDAAEEQLLLLETIRGCIFKCKFCYYPKSYDDLYFVSEEKIVANLEHARRRGAQEVVLLDPTLNQRRNFPDFLRLLAQGNPQRQFTYFGELRAEGITPEIARLLWEAGFDEVEIGLQSIDPAAMQLMDRHNNLKAFERGARAMLDLGIKVKVDLIIGLPGDTVDSVRRGIDYIHRTGLYSQVQVFNLAILPGTAFRQEAAQLGLRYQDRPPYYVLETPTLSTQQMYDLMAEAEEVFETEFDPLPEPVLYKAATVRPEYKAATAGRVEPQTDLATCWRLDLDNNADANPPPLPAQRSQAFTLWLKSSDFHHARTRAAQWVEQLLADNPFTTLQMVLEPTGDAAELSEALTTCCCDAMLRAALRNPTYLDRFYSVQPGRMKGAKRLVIVLPVELSETLTAPWSGWLEEIGAFATIVWRNSQTAEAIPTATYQ